MYALRRWFVKYWVRTLAISLALGGAWGLRQAQSGPLAEVYGWLAAPLSTTPDQRMVLENARILELQQRIDDLESRNRQMQGLVEHQATLPTKGTVAPVIGRSADRWWEQVVLGRGSRAGIQKGDIVTAPGGLVGRIVQVTPSTSRVLLVSDATSRVGATVSRSRFMGYLHGTNGAQVKMEFFDKMPDAKVGDTVTTSAYSRLFPPGIPIGTIDFIDTKKGPAPEATVALSAPLSMLEWVVVIPHNGDAVLELPELPELSDED
ncbi:MAG: rod shape-determining protein MreC [Cyanobacteria bacterium]|nr:rod shape-determining protein MreC [Cyanobacteriota bacterium]